VIRRYLESKESGNWVLIIDNADDMQAVPWTWVQGRLSDLAHGRILITTRSKDVALTVTDDNVVELKGMEKEEARDFLEKLLPKEVLGDDEAIVTLLRDLAHLPLAISQAAAYIKRNGISISKYASLLWDKDREAIGLMSREFPDQTRYKESRHAVAKTWLVSFEQIRRDDRPAAELLSFISQIEPRAIPQSMLPMSGTEQLVHAIGTLKGYAFLEEREDGGMFDMHNLVHLAAKAWIGMEEPAEKVRKAALAHLVTVFETDSARDGNNTCPMC